MKISSLLILFCLFSFISTHISFGAGILMRVQQGKKQRQQQQGMTEEEYELQQQQQQQAPSQAPAPVPLTYQQQVDQRNQAIAQAILNANNKAVTGLQSSSAPATYAGAGPLPVVTPQAAANAPAQPQEVVDLSEVWKKLDKKSVVWTLLIDDQSKILTVSEYIDRYRQEGVKINEPPLHYVQMIDQITGGNPQMLQMPFGDLLKIAAIVDYDFDNGMSKDDLARKVLGEAGYEANKQRFKK